MSEMKVTGMTVSLELKRSTYGGTDAENRFVSIHAEVPTGIEGLSLEEALAQSLQVHLTAWESLYSAELAAGRMKSDDYNARLVSVRKRTAKLSSFLTTPEESHE